MKGWYRGDRADPSVCGPASTLHFTRLHQGLWLRMALPSHHLAPGILCGLPVLHTREAELNEIKHVCVHAAKSCPTLCNPMDCSPPGSSVLGILQARTLEWELFPSTGDLLDPGIEPASFVFPVLAGGFFTTVHLGSQDKAQAG